MKNFTEFADECQYFNKQNIYCRRTLRDCVEHSCPLYITYNKHNVSSSARAHSYTEPVSKGDLLAEIEKYLSSIEISEGLPAIEINKDCSGAIRIESKNANVYEYKTFENLQEFLKIILSKRTV